MYMYNYVEGTITGINRCIPETVFSHYFVYVATTHGNGVYVATTHGNVQ